MRRNTGDSKQAAAQLLVGESALFLQQLFFDRMLERAATVREAGLRHRSLAVGAGLDLGSTALVTRAPTRSFKQFLGCRVMWDEASHRMRPLLVSLGQQWRQQGPGQGSASNAVLKALTMVCVLTCVCISIDDASGAWMMVQRWEPWMCPVRLMPSSTADAIAEALLSGMPFALDKPGDRARLLRACDAAIITLLCDSASANLRAVRFMHHCARLGGEKILLHCEACHVHQVHIAKPSAIGLAGVAGTLYSLSKLMQQPSMRAATAAE